jgi:hypothetical protein
VNGIRKIHVATEEIRLEGGRPVEPPLTTVIVAAVMPNPWAGRPFVEDLHPDVLGFAHDLGAFMADRLLDALGSPEALEAYGKSSVVGVDGELEHANAMIHTLMFGDPIRVRAEASSTLVFTNTRGGPGAPIIVPMVHKDEMLRRTHYHTAQTAVADAPRSDEVIVALAGASRGRPFPRIGDRDLDQPHRRAT